MKPGDLQLVARDHAALWTPALPVENPADVQPYIGPMRFLMDVGPVRAVGLAAPQVGVSLRFFISNKSGVVVNPTIIQRSEQRTSAREGCMSWNRGSSQTFVARFDTIAAHWVTPDGTPVYRFMRGLEARIFQHECDHLDGVCIFSR